MIKSPSIPSPDHLPRSTSEVVRPMREVLEILKGRRGGFPAKLGPTATDEQRTNKINEILDWLQL